MQGAIHCIALDRNQAALDIWREPGLHRCRQPAQQSDTRRAELAKPADQFVDLLGGFPDDSARYGIA